MKSIAILHQCRDLKYVAGFEMLSDDASRSPLIFSFSPAWEAVELILAVCVCLSMRKSRDILGAVYLPLLDVQ